MYIIGVSLVALLAGCSTYGWADAPRSGDGEGSDVPVRVESIAAPAQLGLDHSALRTLLIDEMERSGITVITSGAPATVRCSVTNYESTGFEHDVVVELDFNCHILAAGEETPAHTVVVRGFSTDVIGGNPTFTQAAIASTRRAGNLAAVDAISRVAPQLANQLLNTAPDKRDIDDE